MCHLEFEDTIPSLTVSHFLTANESTIHLWTVPINTENVIEINPH